MARKPPKNMMKRRSYWIELEAKDVAGHAFVIRKAGLLHLANSVSVLRHGVLAREHALSANAMPLYAYAYHGAGLPMQTLAQYAGNPNTNVSAKTRAKPASAHRKTVVASGGVC